MLKTNSKTHFINQFIFGRIGINIIPNLLIDAYENVNLMPPFNVKYVSNEECINDTTKSPKIYSKVLSALLK